MKNIKSVYLDNGASSFPKAPGVGEAMQDYILNIGANVSRSTHSSAKAASMRVFDSRSKLKEFFDFPESESNVIFTPGATFSLNQAIKGYLKAGDHLLVSSLEHNAVMRPARELEKEGVKLSFIPANKDGISTKEDFLSVFTDDVSMVVVSHASNVCGSIFPLEEVAEILKEKNIPLVLDASQSAGHLDISFNKLGLSALCAPGHKGLLGPQGIGILLLKSEFAKRLKPVLTGGTGSLSDSEIQPEFLPDKFESGTPNIPGIFGLYASLEYIMKKGIANIRKTEENLCSYFLELLKKEQVDENKPFRIVGVSNSKDSEEFHKRLGVIALDFPDDDNAEISYLLEENYGIKTRCGMHCAPTAHKTLKTFPQGVVRFSLGHFNTREEIEYTINAIKELTNE